jgi:hypothetical protein
MLTTVNDVQEPDDPDFAGEGNGRDGSFSSDKSISVLSVIQLMCEQVEWPA